MIMLVGGIAYHEYSWRGFVMTGLIIAFVILYVTGILSLLYGKKMMDGLFSVYAFMGVFRFVTTHMEHTEYVLILAIIAGILGILLVKFAKDAAFFLLGAFGGLIVARELIPFLPVTVMPYAFAIEVGIAVAGGVIIVKNSDDLLRFATSYIGGELIAVPTMFLLMRSDQIEGLMNDHVQQAVVNLSKYLYGTFQTEYSLYIIVISVILMLWGASYQKKHK